MEKKFCETHRFYYSGDVCPICQREKYETKKKKKKEYTRKRKIDKYED